jgi:hypothetical protein
VANQNLEAVDRLVRRVRELDRCHGLRRPGFRRRAGAPAPPHKAAAAACATRAGRDAPRASSFVDGFHRPPPRSRGPGAGASPRRALEMTRDAAFRRRELHPKSRKENS